MKIGIIGAMEEEITLLRQAMSITKQTEIGGRIFYEGTIDNVKVAAAITTTIK